MATDEPTLSEDHRQKLDGIVGQMVQNKESDENIKSVVQDYKQKYGSGAPSPGVFGFIKDVNARIRKERPGPLGEIMSRVAPETPTQAAILGATAVAGPLSAGMRTVPAILTRVGAATAGGAGAGAVSGEGATAGAAQGAIGGTLGEALGLGKNIYGLWGPGKAKQFAEGRAAQLGQAIEDATKGAIPGLRTSQDLYEAGTKRFGEYRQALYDLMKRKSEEAASRIGQRTMNVPAVPGGAVQPGGTGTILPPPGTPATAAPVPASTMPTGGVTLDEVNAALAGRGYKGYGGAKAVPAGREYPGTEARLDYGATMKQTSGELNRMDDTGQAAKDWLEGREAFGVGKRFLDLLARTPYSRGSEGEKLVNLNRVKDVYDKKIAPQLVQYVQQGRMTQAEADAIQNAVYSGAQFGSRDTLAGAYSNLDAFKALLRGEGGSPRIISSQIRTVLPGAGNKYVGKLPGYEPVSPGAQTLLDLLTESVVGKTGGTP